MSQTLQLPKWFDLHTHFRQGENVAAYIADHLSMGCAGALAMPNTQPPVSRIDDHIGNDEWSIKGYRETLLNAGGDAFEQLIVPLYLTGKTTVVDIKKGAESGLLRACKYYPPHGTTNSEHGVPIEKWIDGDVLRSMEENEIILCLHGEQHGLSGADYFDEKATAESKFYTEWMPRLLDAHPNLRLVCEHITTETATEFVKAAPKDQVAATITPQHLLYTIGDLIQGLRYHLYCLPIVKFERDREALRSAVSQADQSRFFAGTDRAPHTKKATDCGCAAGCYTGGCAPQLYAMAFEDAGIDLNTESGRSCFERFLCTNGPEFYRFPISSETFTLVREASSTKALSTNDAPVIPLPLGMDLELSWSIQSV